MLLRLDLDVPLVADGKEVGDETRLLAAEKTIRYLKNHGARVVVMAHLGRPGGRREKSLSLRPVGKALSGLLKEEIGFGPFVLGKEARQRTERLEPGKILLLENLRFYPGEEENWPSFTKALVSLGDIFVNEAFAVSHRKHASVVGLPPFLPTAFGFNFLAEVEALAKVYRQPVRPVVVVLGGKKGGKLAEAQALLGWADELLLGGKLVEEEMIKETPGHRKVVAKLTKSGEDITPESAEQFARIVRQAGTVVWNGPLGIYEKQRTARGTKVVAQALAEGKAFSVVGGGDTEAALTQFGLEKKMKLISTGGGAMLTFLASGGDLPGIRVVLDLKKGGKKW